MEIENKVEKSGLLQIASDQYVPQNDQVFWLDFDASFLNPEMPIVREKQLRSDLKAFDLSTISPEQTVGILLSESTLYPQWLNMLLTSFFKANNLIAIVGSNQEDILRKTALFKLRNEDPTELQDKRVIVKGCSHFAFPEFLPEFIFKYQGVAKSIMFGEACSAVPIHKR